MKPASKLLKQTLILGLITAFLIGCNSSNDTPETAKEVEIQIDKNSTSAVTEQTAAAESASESQKETNKAIIQRYLTAKETSGFTSLSDELLTTNHIKTRSEFENLLFNADDPILSAASQPMLEVFPDRKNTITRLLGQNQFVAATYRISGTHQGSLYGIEATGKTIDIDAASIFRLENGKIIESWFMADEAGLLRQLGAKLPARQDGQLNVPPKRGDIRTYDEALAEHLADPKDTKEFQQTRLLLAYKSLPENRPADYQFEGRPYSVYTRSGIVNIVERGAELGVEGSHGKSLSNRRDMVSLVISDGEYSMMQFRLTAQNTGELYGIPSSGNPLDDWEMGFARFEGDTWVEGWCFKDELGYLLNIGNEEALNFLVGD